MKRISILIFLVISIIIISPISFAQVNTTVSNDSLTEKAETCKQKTNFNMDNEKLNQMEENKIRASDWIAAISGIIAFAALILSIITSVKTSNLANKDYMLTHRPFVWVENFGYLDDQNIIVNPINEVMIRVLNSPANFIKESYEYYIVDNNGNKNIIEKQVYENRIRYPDEKSQYTNTSSKVTEQILASLDANQEIERIIRIDYSWLSSERIYYFEAKWRLDKISKTWKVITQNAD